MNIQEIEKIKSLINFSPILTAAERAEWLALLDVMNDKQLGELEGILGSESRKSEGQKSDKSEIRTLTPSFAKASEGKPALSQREREKNTGNKSGSATITSPSPSFERRGMEQQQQPQMPKLSHIVNLPNFSQIIGNRQEATVKSAHDKQEIIQKKPSAFAAKLKSIFQEKELPAGHEELELSDGKVGSSAVAKAMADKGQWVVGSEKQEIGKVQDQKTSGVPPKPFFPVKEKPPVIPPSVKPGLPELKVPLPPKPKVVSPAVSAPPPLTPKPAPIISAPIKESLPEKQPAPKPLAQKPPALEQPAINTLQDLALFENRTLRTLSLDDLVKKIKQLVAKYGYFEVIFNLEKSRAYKNYISTGLELLSGQSNFVSLGARQEGEYLSKEEFEKFTDLLAKIQTS